jgi:hypothetical protein
MSSKRKTISFPSSMHLDGVSATNHLVISNLFASRYQKMFVPDSSPGNTHNLDHKLRKFDILDINLIEEEILKGLLQLNPNRAGRPPSFLINCAES